VLVAVVVGAVVPVENSKRAASGAVDTISAPQGLVDRYQSRIAPSSRLTPVRAGGTTGDNAEAARCRVDVVAARQQQTRGDAQRQRRHAAAEDREQVPNDPGQRRRPYVRPDGDADGALAQSDEKRFWARRRGTRQGQPYSCEQAAEQRWRWRVPQSQQTRQSKREGD